MSFPYIENAIIECQTESSAIIISCDPGFLFRDGRLTHTAYCLDTGKWSYDYNDECQGTHRVHMFD